MLALTTPIKTRLQALAPLAGWQVRTNTEDADRTVLPVADVRCVGAGVADRKTSAAMVAPEWTVALIVRRGAGAADALDQAMAAVIGALHNWHPGQQGGRGWEPLALLRITEPMLAEEGLVGYELTFTTGAKYDGQN